VLKCTGSSKAIMGMKMFETEQLEQTVDPGPGVTRTDAIEIAAGDNEER